MTALDLSALKALAEKATPGPWVADPEAPAWTATQYVRAPSLGDDQDDVVADVVDFHDAEFIVALVNAWPALLARVEEAEGRLRTIALYCENQGDKFRHHAARILAMLPVPADGEGT